MAAFAVELGSRLRRAEDHAVFRQERLRVGLPRHAAHPAEPAAMDHHPDHGDDGGHASRHRQRLDGRSAPVRQTQLERTGLRQGMLGHMDGRRLQRLAGGRTVHPTVQHHPAHLRGRHERRRILRRQGPDPEPRRFGREPERHEPDRRPASRGGGQFEPDRDQ